MQNDQGEKEGSTNASKYKTLALSLIGLVEVFRHL